MGQDIANMRDSDPGHPEYDREYGTKQRRRDAERIAALEESLAHYQAAVNLVLEVLNEDAHPHLFKSIRAVVAGGSVPYKSPLQAKLDRMTHANERNLTREYPK
jgi:hypothetical protein